MTPVFAIYSHSVCERHDMGGGHPESPRRLDAVRAGIESADLPDPVYRQAARVQRDALLRVHAQAHLEMIENASPERGLRSLDPDTAMNPFSLEAAFQAAGAVTQAVDAVLNGECDRAFCAVRPPGHHAEYRRPMGFCLFNNVACGAAHALARGLSRVAIVDFDVHHGNGTEDIFRDDARVLFCSSFQHPFYPGTPLAEREHLVHCPLPAGSDGTTFRRALNDKWWPAIEAFAPELILVSAGFDAHHSDPLAQLNLDEDDFLWVSSMIAQLAEQYCRGRIVSTLEGGYDLAALETSTRAHLEGLARSSG